MASLKTDSIGVDDGTIHFEASFSFTAISSGGAKLRTEGRAEYKNDTTNDDSPGTLEVKFGANIQDRKATAATKRKTFEIQDPVHTADDFREVLRDTYERLGIQRLDRWAENQGGPEIESGTELIQEDPDEREVTFRTWYTAGPREYQLWTEYKLNPFKAPEDTIAGIERRRKDGEERGKSEFEIDADDVEDFGSFKELARSEHDSRAGEFLESDVS